jgi:hypothetical protein
LHAIFISYRQDGSRGWAAYLHELLQRAFEPDQVFLDNEDIRSGDWQQQLDAALVQCRAFVLIIGPQWLQSAAADGRPRLLDPADVHRAEIETALAREAVTVIPLLVDGARMPAQPELPASIAQLALCQALDLPGGGWRGASSRKRLLEEISRATGLPVREGAMSGAVWWSAAKTVGVVLVATLLSSIAAVVICQVVFGFDLAKPDVLVLTLGLLGAWSVLAWWRRRRVQLPSGQRHA